MKKNLPMVGLALGLLMAAIYYFPHLNTAEAAAEIIIDNEPEEKSKATRVGEIMKQEFEKTKDPQTGKVYPDLLPSIRAYAIEKRRNMPSGVRTAIANVDWTERGPNNIGGRTRAILIDANDVTNKTIWAGSVSGGLWKTTDISAADPNWQAVDETWDNLAITAIAQDPSTPNTIYVGTGEGWFNYDYVRGLGLWKTTDGGTTWAQISSTNNNSDFYYVNKIVIDGSGNVYAATNNGLHKSTDGGTTWSTVLDGSSPSADGVDNRVNDVEIAADGDFYAALYEDGVFHSTDAGATWTQLSSVLPNAGFDRVEIACAPSDANTVYAIYEDDSDGTIYESGSGNGFYKTTDGGTTWSTGSTPTMCDQGTEKDVTRGQAWYDLILGVSPSNASHVFVGGVDAAKSTDGGSTWSFLTSWTGGASGTCSSSAPYVHADQHAIIFEDANTFYIGSDGGISRTTDGGATFETKNLGYNVTQYYAADLHPDAHSFYFIAGAQDNGSLVTNSAGIGPATEVTGGDGAFCHIDQDNGDVQITAYTNNYIYYSYNAGASFSTLFSAGDGSFINVTEFDDDANILYSNKGSGQLYRFSDIDGTSTPSATALNLSGTIGSNSITAITADVNTANKIWIGTNAKVYEVTSANGTPSVSDKSTGLPSSGTISCIAVEDGDANHLLVSYSNYNVNSVWESTDGGSSWTSVEGNLPNMPVRWCVFNPNNADQALLATEVGVWSTDNLDNSSTDWDPTNGGLSNCRIDMLKYRTSDNLMIAGTHGRGIFSTDAFTTEQAIFGVESTLGWMGSAFQFVDASHKATSWSWDFGDGNTSTDQHPSHTYTAAGTYTVSLTINGGGAANKVETKTGYITVLPQKGTPYNENSGDFTTNIGELAAVLETGSMILWEKGQPTGANPNFSSATDVWVTRLDGVIPEEDNLSYLYTADFNLSAAGSYTFEITFRQESYFNNSPAALQVQYSTNKGTSWQRLGDYDASNWYNTNSTWSSIFSDQTAFLFWTTSQRTKSLDISSLAGNESVIFRFVYSVQSGGNSLGFDCGFMLQDFNITGATNAPLPVELARFEGVSREDGNTLAWTTLSETNNDFFTLEHATDEKDFERIAIVEGNGNTVETIDYTFLHEEFAPGNHYYRLLQTDYDGTINDLGVVTLKRSEGVEVKTFPNPFSDYLMIESPSFSKENTTVSIFDSAGKLIMRPSINDNESRIRINTQNFPKGIYQVFIENGKDRTIKQIIKK